MSAFQSLLAPYMEDYLTYRQALGYSASSFAPFLSELDRFLCSHSPATISLDKETVLQWLERRPREGLSSQNRRAGLIRGFAKYLSAVGIPAFILPTRFLSSKRTFAPHVFTDDELSALFTAIDNNGLKDPLEALGFSTMLRLIYTCGLRPGEGRLLRTADVNLDAGTVHIEDGKQHIERTVIMADEMNRAMIAYAEKRRKEFPYAETFFTTSSGESFSKEKLRKQFLACWRRCHPNVPAKDIPRVRIYDLRHRFACAALNRWLDEGRDLYVMLPYLSTYMGHSTLSSTAYYIHLLPENLIKSPGIDWDSLNALIPEVTIW